jgi:hypothetical protein
LEDNMTTKKHQREMDERRLAEIASSRVKVEDDVEPGKPIPGRPLPEGLINPPCGQRGHYCVDPQGRYQPDWYALKLHKTSENMPQRQYFNQNGKSWFVQVGTWVDVPPQILTILKYTEQQVISMDMTDTALRSGRSVPRVVDVVPRFSYTAERSA